MKTSLNSNAKSKKEATLRGHKGPFVTLSQHKSGRFGLRPVSEEHQPQ